MKRSGYIILLFSLWVGSGFAAAQEELVTDQYQKYRYREFINADRATQDTVNLDSFLERVFDPDQPLKSVEAVLAWLRRHHPSYLRRFTWMRKSLSLQGAHPLHPRTIVYGQSGNFLLTFTDKNQVGGNRIEMIQVRHQGGLVNYEFRELEFSENGPHVSPPNPERCQRCHFYPLRPIWEEYDHWPGAYGEHDDGVYYEPPHSITGSKVPSLYPWEKERNIDYAHFRKFIRTVEKHPRYGLLPFAKEFPTAPYAPNEKFFDYDYRPNDGLLHAIRRHYGEYVAGLVARSSNYPHVGELFHANLIHCPSEAHKTLSAANRHFVEWFELEVPGAAKQPDYDGYKSLKDNPAQKAEIYLFQTLGVDKENFVFSRVPKAWNFNDGNGDIRTRIRKAMWSLPLIKQAYKKASLTAEKTWHKDPMQLLCQELLKSYQDDSFTKRLSLRTSEAYQREVVQMCIGCHQTKKGAPKWTFDEVGREQAERIFKRINHSKSPMPPNRSLSGTEMRALGQWLTGLHPTLPVD